MITEAKINFKSEAEAALLEPIVLAINLADVLVGASGYYSNRIIARTKAYAEQDGRLPLAQRLFIRTLSPSARFDADRSEKIGIARYLQGAQNG